MKNEFINMLEENERILFYGVSDVSKTNKQYGRLLLMFVFLILCWFLLISGVRSEGIFNLKAIICFSTLVLLTISLFWGFIYNIFLKYKSKNNEYFITDKRVVLYNQKKGFVMDNIFNIEYIDISREKNNYGDVLFSFRDVNLMEQMKNGICFEGVENPRRVVEIIKSINSQVYISDDRPIVMGKKI